MPACDRENMYFRLQNYYSGLPPPVVSSLLPVPYAGHGRRGMHTDRQYGYHHSYRVWLMSDSPGTQMYLYRVSCLTSQAYHGSRGILSCSQKDNSDLQGRYYNNWSGGISGMSRHEGYDRMCTGL